MDLFKFCRTYSKANRPFCPLNQIIVGIINVYHVYSLSPHFTFLFSFLFLHFAFQQISNQILQMRLGSWCRLPCTHLMVWWQRNNSGQGFEKHCILWLLEYSYFCLHCSKLEILGSDTSERGTSKQTYMLSSHKKNGRSMSQYFAKALLYQQLYSFEF